MKLLVTQVLFFFISYFSFGQNSLYSALLIPNDLKESANSVIRNQEIDISIKSQTLVTIKTKKVITVLNQYGVNNIDARVYYSKSEKINAIEAIILDSYGQEIKKIKRKDFKDYSVSDGFSVANDDRYLILDYTPINYPFTVLFESETETSNTAFIPSWNPIDDFFESVEKSRITINYSNDLGFKYKEKNFEGKSIQKLEQSNSISFFAEKLMAEKPEDYMPSVSELFPKVLFGLESFNLEGVHGNASSWKDFGIWMYGALLNQTEEVSMETIGKINKLIGTETNPIEKAKIIYKFVQDNTRYVSIQLGIGGWKPMLAKDVDRLGYGDCKALTNYTRVLLKNVGVESFYTVIYGDRNKKDVEKDFVSMQGNHIILTIPNQNKNLFLECTSQTNPFGYQGKFTDDRYALLVKPDGGEIIKTNEYEDKSNTQISNGSYSIDGDGNLTGLITIYSKGTQYDGKRGLESESKENIEKHYKDYFSNINNLKINTITFNNDKENVEFAENIKISAQNYGNLSSSRMMFPVNAFNKVENIPQRYRNRKKDLVISRGYLDQDEIEVLIPDGFVIEAQPNTVEINEKFGNYKLEIIIINNSKFLYKRKMLLNKGKFDKSEYDNFRLFMENIAKTDNSKIVLIKK